MMAPKVFLLTSVSTIFMALDAAVVLTDERGGCDTFCPANIQPVCGSDGQTYANLCLLNAASCEKGEFIFAVKSGDCSHVSPTKRDGGGRASPTRQENPLAGLSRSDVLKVYELASKRCRVGCQRIYMPVCGNNGKTYDNQCLLDEEACVFNRTDLRMAAQGRCEELETLSTRDADCPSICQLVYRPVCGTDGKTYPNRCSLKLASCRGNRKIEVRNVGRCKFELSGVVDEDGQPVEGVFVSDGTVDDCPTFCTFEFDPVCGDDGVTYSNHCKLKVASCVKNEEISLVFPGPCSSRRPEIQPVVAEDESCPDIFSPVCGTDGVTYSSQCALQKIARMLGLNIGMAHLGRCSAGEWFQ